MSLATLADIKYHQQREVDMMNLIAMTGLTREEIVTGYQASPLSWGAYYRFLMQANCNPPNFDMLRDRLQADEEARQLFRDTMDNLLSRLINENGMEEGEAKLYLGRMLFKVLDELEAEGKFNAP